MPRRTNKHKKKKKAANSGLGKAIKNKFGGKPDRENKAKGKTKRKDYVIESSFASNPIQQKKLKSITEVNNIQEFVDTIKAQKEIEDHLRETEDLKLIEIDPSESMVAKEIKFHQQLNEAELFNYENLPIPRKPKWDKNTTPQQLDIMQKTTFVNWRRGLSNTAKQTNMEMTPFEKNINVWKQLWNVVERANLLILIVDARNPLAFISRDFFKYVKQVDARKRCILMINKADYLTPLQRQYWSAYFASQQIEILYFSAMREQIRFDLMTKSNRDHISEQQRDTIIHNIDSINDMNHFNDKNKVLKVEELVDIFLLIKKELCLDTRIEVGFVGYPNVGKSSIINVLMKEKKVSVASTPGKTKHFQTLILNEEITLCDCPGLVFPTLMSSKSDMILNGVISIDHLTDFIKPSRLMIHRISVEKLNECYNLRLPTNKKRMKFLTVYDILDSYCHQKKMYNKSKVPNRNEAARILLKAYVKGKIVYNHFPPNLNSRNKYLFYNGKILSTKKTYTDNKKINVLDQAKLDAKNNGLMPDIDENVEVDDDFEDEVDDDGDVDVGAMDKITDEEFLDIWKHPMDEYGGTLGTSKKKHDKKARVIRRIEKKNQKQNRQFRRDFDNFQTGSNAVVISCVPHIQAKHTPVLL